jgi:hypothetical protein
VTRTSWQTLLADLALVLFMVTVGALVRAKRAHAPAQAVPPALNEPVTAPQEATPLSVYRDVPGAPPLGAWIQQQPRDARQQITIVVRYLPGTERALSARVDAVLAAAREAGAHPRIVIEPGNTGISAGIGFDAPPEPVARDLLSSSNTLHHRTRP